MEKRGVSTIVVTVILVALALVALGVVWYVISTVILGGTSSIGGLGRFTIDLDIQNAQVQGNDIVADVERPQGKGDLVGINFILSDGETTETIKKETTLSELESGSFTLTPSKFTPAEVVKIFVAPIYLSGGDEKIGDVVDTYIMGSGGDGGDGGLPDCTPNCNGDDGLPGTEDDLQCGPDPVCGTECGPCTGTDVCTNGVCVPFECEPETLEETCGEWVCGDKVNNCGAEIECPPGCAPGEMCNLGVCYTITPDNSGIVEDVWPGTSGMYFGSSDLPTDEETDYTGQYLSYTGGAECLLIAKFIPPVLGYDKSHIAFNFETDIEVGDTYNIWTTLDECQATLGI